MIFNDEELIAGIDFDILRYSKSKSGTGEVVFVGNSIVVPPFDRGEYPDCPYPETGQRSLISRNRRSASSSTEKTDIFICRASSAVLILR